MKAFQGGLSSRLKWKRRCLELGWEAWNVRTFGSSVKVGDSGQHRVEGDVTKPEEFCRVMEEANLSLCCLSEIRWKGEGVIQIGEFSVLFSGVEQSAPRSVQGVGIALNRHMRQAWESADCYCSYGGSRLLHIKLKLSGRLVNVISVYAPTFKAEDVEKDRFYADLEEIVNSAGSGEPVFVMGDFNARVGRNSEAQGSGCTDGLCSTSPFGMGHVNENGQRLLAFCEGNQKGLLKVAGTWLNHKHYGTWLHNKTKLWHHIDHVLVPAKWMRWVMDVAVKPGVVFDTDHRLVKLKLRIPPMAHWPREQCDRGVSYRLRPPSQSQCPSSETT